MQFIAEDEVVKRPVLISDDVLAILAKDELVQNELDDQKVSVGNLPSSWFSTSAIPMAGPDEIDLVVLGEGQLSSAGPR
jgi:hypothetical protein